MKKTFLLLCCFIVGVAQASNSLISQFKNVESFFAVNEEQVLDYLYAEGVDFSYGDDGIDCPAEIIKAEIEYLDYHKREFMIRFLAEQDFFSQHGCFYDPIPCWALFKERSSQGHIYDRFTVEMKCFEN